MSVPFSGYLRERGLFRWPGKTSGMSLCYLTGYIALLCARLLRKLARGLQLLALIPEHLVMIVWTSREKDRYAKALWNGRESVEANSRAHYVATGLFEVERELLTRHNLTHGNTLVLACGAGREALALAKFGVQVTAVDWSPRTIERARREAERAGLPITFAVADLHDLRYPERTFDHLWLTNRGYSYLTPRERRVGFLRQARLRLQPGGLFLVSFGPGGTPSNHHLLKAALHRLASRFTHHPPFRGEYEPGDFVAEGGLLVHCFLDEAALKGEFEEGGFGIKEWRWEEGFAVLAGMGGTRRLA